MGAVLACGAHAALSHSSAAALWELAPDRSAFIEVLVPSGGPRAPVGVRLHRSTLTEGETTRRHGIPVTKPARTLVDLAGLLARGRGSSSTRRLLESPAGRRLERAANEADKLGLVDPETLRAELERHARRPGVAVLRELLDRRTFVLTDSELEGRFLPIARRAGLGRPETGAEVNGYRVDFFWRELGLVVETDGLTYHRTPAQQTRDRERDQAHAAAGLTPLRFTYEQVRYEPERVQSTLAAVAERLTAGGTLAA
jgi:very-short-patch-repair endonuclease